MVVKKALLIFAMVMVTAAMAQGLPDGGSPQPSSQGGTTMATASFAGHTLAVPIGATGIEAWQLAVPYGAVDAVWPARLDDRFDLLLAAGVVSASLPEATFALSGPSRAMSRWSAGMA